MNDFSLSAKRRALLSKLLEEHGVEQVPTESIPRAAIGDDAPLSFAQRRLWFLDQLMPGSPFYNIYTSLPINFPLNVDVLQRSLDEIIRRHEILRTCYKSRGGEPLQLVMPEFALPLRHIDLRGEPAAGRRASAHRLATEEAKQPFDLARSPPLRVTLIRLDEHQYLLLFTVHHIAADGWSMGLFFHELTALYQAYAIGKAPALPELAIQYRDYAVWQRAWLVGDRFDKQLAYWRNKLHDLPTLQLTGDHPRPADFSFRGAFAQIRFPTSLYEALKALSQQEGVTLFMTLLAGFKTVLQRWTGQDDIVVGSPIAGRDRSELEPLVGLFVNTLVMRTDLSGNPGFRELLHRVETTALGAFEHHDLPFEMLVESLQPERDTSRNPLFQVVFQLINAPATQGPATAASVPGDNTMQPVSTETAKFDLTLSLQEANGELTGVAEYNTDLFDAASIERLMAQLRYLLESAVANPDKPLSALRIMSADQHAKWLSAATDARADYPRNAAIHSLFEAQATQAPDAIAVVFGEQRLSYGQLDRRANRIAQLLRKSGMAAGSLVGVCVERSVDLIALLLGVLKTGAAYLPLDPSYPAVRLAAILDDAHADLLVTQADTADALAGTKVQTLSLGRMRERIESQPATAPSSDVTGGHVAYVMYTSGSTGVPKGIAIPHRAVVRLVCNTNYVGLGPDDCIAQVSNASFDASTFEVWGALLCGARLVGVAHAELLSVERLAALVSTHGINTMFLTTAFFNQLSRQRPQLFAQMKTVLFGGEAVDPRWVARVLKKGRPERLLHVYGPTESTTFASWHPVTDVCASADTVPIGRAVANTDLYVLDRHGQLAPDGVPGELFIGGDGLAVGYLRRPDLTAERFVPNPFAIRPGERLYRTGDRVRRRVDGAIEFLGRLDGQIKLRGFRIEPQEIEACLCQHERICEAVVMLREDTLGEKSLVAYVAGKVEAQDTAAMLRTYLKGCLPAFMIPSHIVCLVELPLNVNGKVDRDALPAPGQPQPGLPHEPPATDHERLVADVWCQVLGVERVGLDDNFFDLGGHSLLMIRVQSGLSESLGREIPMLMLFSHPTVRTLAAHVAGKATITRQSHSVRERAAKRKKAIAQRFRSKV